MPNLSTKLRSLLSSRPLPRISVLIAFPFVVLCLGGWQKSGAAADSAPAFATSVAPIVQKTCVSCHSSASHKGGLVLDSYEALMKGGKDGKVVVAHDPD